MVTMWSVNTFPNPGLSSSAARSCGVFRWEDGRTSNVNPLVVVPLLMGFSGPLTYMGRQRCRSAIQSGGIGAPRASADLKPVHGRHGKGRALPDEVRGRARPQRTLLQIGRASWRERA